MDLAPEDIGALGIGPLVAAGALLHARLRDDFETVPSPVVWLDYQPGHLRYARAGPEARVQSYEIRRVELTPPRVIFHTRGETSVAAVILAPCDNAVLRHTLYSWARRLRGNDPYPPEGWRFTG